MIHPKIQPANNFKDAYFLILGDILVEQANYHNNNQPVNTFSLYLLKGLFALQLNCNVCLMALYAF